MFDSSMNDIDVCTVIVMDLLGESEKRECVSVKGIEWAWSLEWNLLLKDMTIGNVEGQCLLQGWIYNKNYLWFVGGFGGLRFGSDWNDLLYSSNILWSY